MYFFLEAFLQLHVYLNKKSEIFSDISRFSGLAMSRKSSYQSLPDKYSYIKREWSFSLAYRILNFTTAPLNMADSNGPVILEHFSLYSHTTKVNPNAPPEHKNSLSKLGQTCFKGIWTIFSLGFFCLWFSCWIEFLKQGPACKKDLILRKDLISNKWK